MAIASKKKRIREEILVLKKEKLTKIEYGTSNMIPITYFKVEFIQNEKRCGMYFSTKTQLNIFCRWWYIFNTGGLE